MCQSKSLGGKRCAIHHHGTQAAIQTTSVKTGVESSSVSEIFSSLNKEGRKLEEPSRSEYEAYLEKERFMAEIDNTIDTRDKKMILKKLDKAKEENTPSGGTFHAWKNLFSSTIQKFGKKTRLTIAGFTVAAIAFGAAGCAPSSSSGTNLLNGSSISVVQGETVTDSLGTYSHLKLEADSPVYNFPFSPQTIIDKTSIEANGFTEADAAAAQKAAAEFVATEMVDNASIDTPETFAATLQADASKYFIGSYIPVMTDPNKSTIIYKTADGLTFMRDGKTRIANNGLSVIGIEGSSLLDGTKTIAVNGQTETTYRLSKESTTANNGKNSVTVISSWGLYMLPDENGNWKIAGYQTNFETRQ